MDEIALKSEMQGLLTLLKSDLRIRIVVDENIHLMRAIEENCYWVGYKVNTSYVTYARINRSIEDAKLFATELEQGVNIITNATDGAELLRALMDALRLTLDDYNASIPTIASISEIGPM